MNKKQFDHIENKIKEAAENTNYAFEEQAWDKMETLLDKKEDKKRRVFAWWWFALPAIIFSGVYFIINNKGQEKTIIKQDGIIKRGNIIISTPNNITENNTTKAEPEKISAQNNVDAQQPDNIKNPKNNEKLTHHFTIKQKARVHIKTTNSEIANSAEGNNTQPGTVTVNTDEPATTNNLQQDSEEPTARKKEITVANDSTKTILIVTTENKKTVQLKDTVKNKAAGKKPSGHNTSFYLLASVGADAAGTKFLSLDKSSVAPRYGVGAGFQFNKKISIQAGFYASHKIYVAGPGEYKAENGSYLSQVDITKVDANCLVYEIPLTIRYNFIQHKKITYYATSSISSFIMKNEAYNYYYIENNQPSQESKIYTGNKNLFSVLGLSIGIEKPLTNKLSVLAEPSVSIPLTGVGEGSMKLYSTTLLFGLKYNFSKK